MLRVAARLGHRAVSRSVRSAANRPVTSERATSAAVRPVIRLAAGGSHLRPGDGLRPPQPPQVLQHHVQPQTGDELHHEVVMPVLPAHAEDRHDVGVVQPRRRPGLALEPPHLLGVEQRAGREHLQRHAPAQRFLLGLVDHAHAAAADLAEDAVVAQPLQPDPRCRAVVSGQRAGGAAGALAQVLHHQQRREQVADLVGQFGVPLDVFAQRRLLAAALAVEELLGQELDGVAPVAGGAHQFGPLCIRLNELRHRFMCSAVTPSVRAGTFPSPRPPTPAKVALSAPGWTTGSP